MVKKSVRTNADSIDNIGITATEINSDVRESGTTTIGIEETVSPATLESSRNESRNDSIGNGEAGTAEEGRKRGRPPGSSQKASKANIESLASLLSVIHFSLAAATNCSELILTEDEAERLAKASADVSKHYDFGFTDKQKDILAFAVCAGSIYAPKIKDIISKKKVK